jgi:hypothetical protein
MIAHKERLRINKIIREWNEEELKKKNEKE